LDFSEFGYSELKMMMMMYVHIVVFIYILFWKLKSKNSLERSSVRNWVEFLYYLFNYIGGKIQIQIKFKL